jgi:hypothetical protein
MRLWMPKAVGQHGVMCAVLGGMNIILAAMVAASGNWFFAAYGLIQGAILVTWAKQSLGGK